MQARITGALQISLNVAKQNPQNFKVLHPVLQVLKIYAGSRKYSLFLHDSELFANFNERFQKTVPKWEDFPNTNTIILLQQWSVHLFSYRMTKKVTQRNAL